MPEPERGSADNERDMNKPRSRRSLRWGLCAGGGYIAVVILIFSITAVTTRPDNVGLDWIPFILLAMPWFRLGQAQEFLIPGLVLNATISFGLGVVAGVVFRGRRDGAKT